MKHIVLFTADIHGNEVQLSKLVDFAISISADSLIVGGDIAPKRGGREHFIGQQRCMHLLRSWAHNLRLHRPQSLNSVFDTWMCVMEIVQRAVPGINEEEVAYSLAHIHVSSVLFRNFLQR